jgi:hypothetical protein
MDVWDKTYFIGWLRTRTYDVDATQAAEKMCSTWQEAEEYMDYLVVRGILVKTWPGNRGGHCAYKNT